jgi:hypothetical protein
MVQALMGVTPVGDICHSGERREDNGFLEIMMPLKMSAEEKDISK